MVTCFQVTLFLFHSHTVFIFFYLITLKSTLVQNLVIFAFSPSPIFIIRTYAVELKNQ